MEKNNNLMSGKGEKGKWITVNGSHVFIEDGQSVEDAMNKHFQKKDTKLMHGDNSTKNEEQSVKRQSPKYKVSFAENENIDWDIAEQNEKINGKNAKNPKRTDKYGNALLSDEAFNIGVEAGKSYLDYMKKYNDLSSLKRSNVFLGGMSEIIDNAITNNGFNPNQDITNQDFNEIIGNIIGEEVDIQSYETRQSNGFTGRKYIGYKPKY